MEHKRIAWMIRIRKRDSCWRACLKKHLLVGIELIAVKVMTDAIFSKDCSICLQYVFWIPRMVVTSLHTALAHVIELLPMAECTQVAGTYI